MRTNSENNGNDVSWDGIDKNIAKPSRWHSWYCLVASIVLIVQPKKRILITLMAKRKSCRQKLQISQWTCLPTTIEQDVCLAREKKASIF